MGNGIQIGLDKLYYAILNSDVATGVSYQAPVAIPGIKTAKITPNAGTSVLYADDGPAESASYVGEITVEINVKDLSIRQRAALLGHSIVGGVLQEKTSDTPPEIALGFRTKKTNGKYRYMWLLKGRASVPEDDLKTKADNIEFQTPTLKLSFLRRDYDQMYKKTIDEDDVDFVQSLADNWFLDVEGVPDVTAPTATVVPADAATGVVATSTIQWTFSEAIQASDITAANFFIMMADGTQVDGALSIDNTHTIVTFTPGANLAALTDYIAIATTNVKDLAGNPLAAPSVTNFQTA